jgi:DNA modification methylase
MINEIITGNNVEVLRSMSDDFVDLTVTSPPYDNLRKYNGYSFDFEGVANELFRVTTDGGVVVWVVGDETKDFCESMSSFRQALYFKEIGFKLLDTMIYYKQNYAPAYPTLRRYANQFEYMFIFVKGKKPKEFSPIQVAKSEYTIQRQKYSHTPAFRNADGSLARKNIAANSRKETKDASNVWQYPVYGNKTGHPAVFPEKLAEDHIISWSNPGDIVLDPFGGSGTTAKMARKTGRRFIHIDISEDYNEIARKRIEGVDA